MGEDEGVRSDSLQQILKRNPHNPWSSFSLWRRWRKTQILYQDFSRLRVGLTEFEREILVPELVSRLELMQEILERMKGTCANPQVRQRIGPAITALRVVPPGHDPVTSYLDRVSAEIDRFFLRPIAKLRTDARAITNFAALVKFLNGVFFLCGTLTSNEKTLFWYSSLGHAYAVNRATQEVVGQGEPVEFGIILLPFKNDLENLLNVAKGTEGSIDQWRRQQDEAKKPFLDYLAAMALHSTNSMTLWIQMLAIFMAVVLSGFFLVAGDPFALKRTNSQLTEQVRELRARSAEADQNRLSLEERAADAEQKLRQSQGEVERLERENADLRHRLK